MQESFDGDYGRPRVRAASQHRPFRGPEPTDSGRISTLPNGKIDSDVADREWRENTEVRPKGSTRKRQPSSDGGQDGSIASEYAKSRAVREFYDAKMAELAYKEKLGSLISTADM